MFGRIVPRYDLMNALMTFGRDASWRCLTAKAADPQNGLALDLATGTGDLALALWREGAREVVGLDFCPEMLEAAFRKLPPEAAPAVRFVQGDALRLPFPDQTFDCVASAFLLRNVADLEASLVEMARVLKPGGRLTSLDLTHPRPGPLGWGAWLYSRHLVPLLGWAVAGDRAAYNYLPRSLEGFPGAPELARMMERAGLVRADYRLLGLGMVALHRALKPSV